MVDLMMLKMLLCSYYNKLFHSLHGFELSFYAFVLRAVRHLPCDAMQTRCDAMPCHVLIAALAKHLLCVSDTSERGVQ